MAGGLSGRGALPGRNFALLCKAATGAKQPPD